MIGDIRMSIEKERTKNCIFISFLRTRNEGKSGLTVIDGKFAKLIPHRTNTGFHHDCVQILEETILQGRWRRLAAGSTGTTSSSSSSSSSSSNCSCTVVVVLLLLVVVKVAVIGSPLRAFQ